MTILCLLLLLYNFVVLARVISSWIPVPPSGPFRVVLNVVYDLTEPVLRPLRSILPPMRMGPVGLDLSPMVVFFIIFVLRVSICG